MKDTLEHSESRDDIDRIVDALLSHPEQVADIKLLLRRKLGSPETVHVIQPVSKADSGHFAEPDEFWDNFPI